MNGVEDDDAMARDGPMTDDVLTEPVWLSDHYDSWQPSDDDDPKQYLDYQEGDSING